MRVTFRILPNGMIKPSKVSEFRGWIRARIEILSGGPEEKTKEMRFEGKLPSCCVSFKFTAILSVHKGRSITTFKIADKNATIHCQLLHPNGQLERGDLQYMIKELEGRIERNQVDELLKSVPVHTSIIKTYNVYEDLEMEYRCSIFRYVYEQKLLRAMPKQRDRIREMEPTDFKGAYDLLMKQPWLLCYQKHSSPFGLKEMDYDGLNAHRTMEKKQINPVMTCAVRLYCYIKELREGGHTVFEATTLIDGYLNSPGRWKRIADLCGDTPERLETALDFLKYHAFDYHYESGLLCFLKDKMRCDQIMGALQCLVRSQDTPQSRQGEPVPCKPSNTLTGPQKDFVEHVEFNKLTMLVGGPGTGKSECLVALMALYKRPLVVTYIGMMVDALQKRFGCRVETVHTIHSIYYSAPHYPEWLAQFDLIVIDEFSNVDEHLFAKLLGSVPRCSRLVCVGDLGQIYPIKPGCPFRDLIDRYPGFVYRLRENKRVDKDARDLADAAQLITENRVADIPFRDTGPLKLIQNHSDDIVELVVRECAFGDIMKFQAIVLRNMDRKHLNKLIEGVLIKYNVLKPGKMVIKIYGSEGEMNLFVGKKIAFTKNVKPFKNEYDGVRNGELAQIKQIVPVTNASWKLHLHSGKVVLVDNNKTGAVQTFDICAGYATTCNKAQGSEWNHILFWIYKSPVQFFTREYAYVAVSRAKKSCTVVGLFQDLVSMCALCSPPRNTLLSKLLGDFEIPECDEEYNVTGALQLVQDSPILNKTEPAVPLRPNPEAKKKKRPTKKKKHA